jgi:hypothetical protein
MKKSDEDAFFRSVGLFIGRLERIGEIVKSEKKVYNELLSKQTALRGNILTYHLITERLINKELSRLKSSTEINKMTYAKKLQALPRHVAFKELRKGLKQLNIIRNKMAHDLDFEPEMKDITIIINCNEPYYKDSPRKLPKTLDEHLRYFLNICIASFSIRTDKVRGQINKIEDRFPAFKNAFDRFIK